MEGAENIKIGFSQVSRCTCKNRRSKAVIERIDCRMIISGKPNMKRWFYFVRCRDHNQINGSFDLVSNANKAMHNPQDWCSGCCDKQGECHE